jgi:hypothetical protein
VARRQGGVITTAQLRACGLSLGAIASRAKDGRLQRLYRGVYSVTHRALRPEAVWLAALLACGLGAVLSHRSAAVAWRIRRDEHTLVDVTVARAGGRKQRGIEAHQCQLSPADVTRHRGLPITTPARTLLDLAEVLPRLELDRAIEEAMRLRLTTRADLERTLERHNGRKATKPLRASLDALVPLAGHTRSELERRMLGLLADQDLPTPLVNVRLAGYTVDLLWPQQRLVVELDGYAYHHTPQAFERDRERDARLQRAGYRVQRFTWRQVTQDPAMVATTVAALLRTEASPAPPSRPRRSPPRPPPRR